MTNGVSQPPAGHDAGGTLARVGLSAMALQWPRRLTSRSAWLEHVPFAMALIDMLRPGRVVELGTHWGVSYCAFCQSVRHLGLPTRCFAVDTWEGDPHADFYDAGVLADLRAHHDPEYAGFSELIQARFDDALARFEPRSVDLLHIDGLHSYEAVRHDYTSWLPKMSGRGVILFHDTQVRERGFGVWKLWSEVRDPGPSFEFLHGFGLGVLAVGREQPEDFVAFMRGARASPDVVRGLFQVLGQRLTTSVQIDDLRAAVARLTAPPDNQVDRVLNKVRGMTRFRHPR